MKSGIPTKDTAPDATPSFDAFLDGVAHDLANKIGAIRSNLDMIIEWLPDDCREKARALAALRAADKAGRLAVGVTDFLRGAAQFRGEVDSDAALAIVRGALAQPTDRQGAGASGVKTDPASLSVMIVDDNDEFREMLETAVARLGCRVFAVADPLRGIAEVERQPDGWQILIADRSMPGMDGEELVGRVKRLAPAIRCVLCSGLRAPSVLPASIDAYWLKPFNVLGVGQRLEDLFKRRE